MEYRPKEIEKKWQAFWSEKNIFHTSTESSKPKYYVLDMFPYPSGAGLHVGHPLGYIASDIVSRYMRLKGFNVLHPMGYDAFGLPAEQYAIQTGQHPAITTARNIARYRQQLDNIGFSFDWQREVKTSDPKFYKWTQWIFIQLFNSWYNPVTDKAESIESLIEAEIKSGKWNQLSEKEKEIFLLGKRLAYLSETMVNWCPALGTVLANEEVKDGFSERGGFPVERKMMKQWSLRITSYADRLLTGLEEIDWPVSVKEAQKNWIGKSVGAEIRFNLAEKKDSLTVFTTRPDTLFGCSFLVIAPEHSMAENLTLNEKKSEVQSYIQKAKNKSERDRMSETKQVSGVFTGSYAMHPFSGEKLPIWIADYVLAGYGTGAIMAVPAHDSRDYLFAKTFSLPVKEVVSGGDISKEAFEAKDGTLINSDFMNGLTVQDAIKKSIQILEEKKHGKGTVNYRLRDAIFSRQRYWGEPFPVYFENGFPKVLDVKDLPVELPSIDTYLPTETGEPPLARAKNWTTRNGFTPDYNTMPGWAGSSWYFLRYMDPHNENEFVSKKAVQYWQQIDLYLGGAEHATGHLLYFRFWTKFLFDLGYLSFHEPAKKLINQGMILGRSLLLWQGIYHDTKNKDEIILRLCSAGKIPETFTLEGKSYKLQTKTSHRALIQYADSSDKLFEDKFKEMIALDATLQGFDIESQILWEHDLNGARYLQLSPEIEKMSKSKHNVVNPDDIIDTYGADTLRVYEMFLGPLEQHKPWNTNGIEGVSKFLRKFWNLFHRPDGNELKFIVSDDAASKEELKALHKIIKKMEEDVERFSFNTTVSAFMICVNELTDLKCNKREILDPLCIVLAPFAPHLAEELWQQLGHTDGISFAQFPNLNLDYLTEDSFDYPISFNGKTRCNVTISLASGKEEVEKEVLSKEEVQKYLAGKSPKKIIVVHGRIVNIVV